MVFHRAFVFGFIAEQVQRPFSSLCGTHLQALLQGSFCNNLVGLRSPHRGHNNRVVPAKSFCGPTRPRPALTHTAKSSFCRRRHEKERCSFSELSSKPFVGLRSPHPRLLSFHEESNQRRAKEEASSLETPFRGFSPRELRKRSSLPLSAPAA